MVKLLTNLSLIIILCINFLHGYPHYEKEELKFGKNCTLIKNKPIANRNNVQLKLLSDCLFFYIGDRVYNKTGYRDTLTSAPPPSDDRVKVKFTSVKFYDFVERFISPFKKSIKGVAKLSWKDSRLTWNRYEWNLNVLKASDANQIWMPEPDWYNSDGLDSSFTHIHISYDGVISTEITFRLQLTCYEMPGEVLPFERMGCCGKFGTAAADEQRQYVIDSTQLLPIRVDERFKNRLQDACSTGGGVGNAVPAKWKPVVTSSDKRELHFCLMVNSVSKVERSRFLMPIAGTAVLILAAPLFGTVKLQLGTKLFSFLLQFLCFDNSLGMKTYSEWIQSVPVVYRLHELTFVITLTSIFITLFCMGIGSLSCRLPPPHWCHLVTTSGLKFLAFGGKFGKMPSLDQTIVNGAPATVSMSNSVEKTATSANYNEEWNTVIQVVHNLLCLLLSAVYCIVALGLLL